MEYRLLGPLEVRRDSRALDLGSPKQRAVLAALVLARGRTMSIDRLVEAVWGGAAPPSAVPSLQAYVSNLRRVLREPDGRHPVERRQGGYVLVVEEEALDITRFLASVGAARAAADEGCWDDALREADAALALWRGPPLVDLQDEDWVRAEAAGLGERWAECLETQVTALLAQSRTAEALARTSALIAEHPFRERTRWLHLIALHRAGRTAEALEAYRAYVHVLDEELGLGPGRELRELHASILRDDPTVQRWPVRDGRAPGSAVLAEDPAGHLEPVDRPLPGTRPAAVAPAVTGLVGRRHESAAVDRLLVRARAGAPCWLVLTGPPGIGKTRLAEEAVARARAAGGRVAWARCPEEEGAPSWWPLRAIVRALGGDPDEVLLPPRDVDADTARFAMYERIGEFLERAAAAGPLLLVIDDAQWADPTSLRCLAYLTALRDVPVAVVITLRDGEASPAVRHLLSALARHDGAQQIAVAPLGPDEVGDLAAQVAGERVTVSDARLLANRTGGNPLFVAEYARLPREERDRGQVPLAVRTVLGRRLAGLSDEVLHVLRAAAVLGDEVLFDLLAATTGLPIGRVAELIEEAAEAHIIRSAPGAAGYAFAHALLREEVLADVPEMRRQRLHASAAGALARRSDGEGQTRRAAHLVAAQPLVDPVEVVEACTSAARHAAARWDSDTAARWWGAALAAYDRSDDADRDSGRRDDLLVARLTALARAGRGQTVLDVVDDALVEAGRAGRTGTIGRLAAVLLRTSGAWPWASYGDTPGVLLARLAERTAAVAGDPATHVRVLAARAVGSCYAQDPAVPDVLSREALERAERSGDPDLLADALLGRVLAFAGVASRSAEAVDLLDRMVRLPHDQERVDEVLRHNVLTMALSTLGDIAGAEEHLRRGAAGSDLLRLPASRVQLRWAEAMLTQWRGDLDGAERLVGRAHDLHVQTELYEGGVHHVALLSLRWEQGRIAEEEQCLAAVAEPVIWGAAALAQTGDAARAHRLLDEVVPVVTPFYWHTLGHQVLLAHAVADARAVQHARTLVDRLAPHAAYVATIGQGGVIGTVALALGRLHALLGEPDEARRRLTQGLDLAERSGGIPTAVRTRLEVALLDPAGSARDTALAGVAAEADRLGLRQVAARARAGRNPAQPNS